MSYEEVTQKLADANANVFIIPSVRNATADEELSNTTAERLVVCRKVYPYTQKPGYVFSVIDMTLFMSNIESVTKDNHVKFAIYSSDGTPLYTDTGFKSEYLQGKEFSDSAVSVKQNTFIEQSSSSLNINYVYQFNNKGLAGNVSRLILMFGLLEALALAFILIYGGKRATKLDMSITDLTSDNFVLSRRLNENRVYLNRQLIAQMLNGKLNYTLEELKEKHGLSFAYSRFSVMQIYFTDNFELLNNSKEEFIDKMCGLLAENNIVCYPSTDSGSETCVLLNYDEYNDTGSTLRSVIFKVFNTDMQIRKLEKNLYYIGLSKKTERLDEIKLAYEDSYSALNYSIKNNIFITYYEDIKEVSADIYFPYEIETQLYNSIKTGHTEETAALIDKIRNINFVSRKPPYYLLQKLNSIMLVLIYKLIDELYKNDEESRTKFTHACRNVSHSADPSEGYHFLREIALSISGDFECDSSNIDFKDKIISYIDKNFDNRDLSLSMLASHINISYHHLSHIFTDYMGETFISYLTKYRLEHSKELLTQSDEKIDTIAKKCGFSGGNAFAKIFKKHYGITPGKYRSEADCDIQESEEEQQ